jgi:hypothetical protein
VACKRTDLDRELSPHSGADVAHCLHGMSDGDDVCFNDDCHFYNPESKQKHKHQYYSGPSEKREQYCIDAPHCEHTRIQVCPGCKGVLA